MDSAQLLALVAALRGRSRRRDRRRGGRRVRLRARGARVARGAGADPRVRLHRGGARRRRQRRQQRRGPGRPMSRWRRWWARTSPPAGAWRALHARVDRRHVVRARARHHAGEDAHPGRRRPLRQAAGGAHRPRRGQRPSTTAGRAAFERHALRACAARRRRAGVGLRVGAGDAAAGAPRCAPRFAACRPAARRSWWTRATACCSTAGSPPARPTSRRWSRRWASASTTTCACWSGRAASVLERTRNRAVLITRGSRGMALFERGVRRRCTSPSSAATRLPT